MEQGITDTRPEAEAVLYSLLRKASPARKIELVGQMNRMVKSLMLSGLRSRYPDESPEKLRRRLADLMLGQELAKKVYGPLVEKE
jgi:hypothetical protein